MSEEQKPDIPESAPWWVKGIMAIGHAFGVSAILLAFYLGQSAGVIPNPVEEELAEVKKELQEVKGTLVQGTASIKEIVTAIEDQNRQRQLNCVLRAKTDDEKRTCLAQVKP